MISANEKTTKSVKRNKSSKAEQPQSFQMLIMQISQVSDETNQWNVLFLQYVCSGTTPTHKKNVIHHLSLHKGTNQAVG